MKIKITKQDKEFSHFIRARARWRCELCKRKYPDEIKKLDCAHIFGRRNAVLRHDQDNANALCFFCHKYLGENPLLYYIFALKKLGAINLFELIEKHGKGIGKKSKVEAKIFKEIMR